MKETDFTNKELETLAAFVCDRYDSMKDIVADPKVIESFKAGCRPVIKQLETLNDKLRPYYTGPQH